jgi:predicted RNA binding protein YcfA (HicA-like mRNA interferase family)
VKIPRDISGKELAKLLSEFGYEVTRQVGSHIRLTRISEKEQHLTIPDHSSLKIGTLNNILNSIASHLEIDKPTLIKKLWNK